MSEVSVSRFHDMSAELAARIEDTLAVYAREHGQVYSAMAMSQSHQSIRELAQDALTFGMDIWTHGSGDDGDFGGNVIRLPFERKPRRHRTFAGVRMAMSIFGAVAGSTVIAAATTESVSLPYFDRVAHFIYSKNAPSEITRIVEEHGHVYQMRFVRRPGEPWDMVHLEESHELTPAEVAHFRGQDVDDGTALNDPPFHG